MGSFRVGSQGVEKMPYQKAVVSDPTFSLVQSLGFCFGF